MTILHATDTLRERILSKIVMPGPATPCATWVGAYSVGRTRQPYTVHRRPVIQLGRRGSPMIYVTVALLHLAEGAPPSPAHEACHRCPIGTPPDSTYRCVDLAHLRWGTRAENEADKR